MDRRGLRIVLDSLALVALLAIVAFFIAAVRSPDLAQILGTTSVGTSAVNRATLWRDGLGLVSDYPFTGSGLRSTMMVYSTYELLMHVGFILHMHNLFVQIAVSQGVVAVLAFAGLLAAAIANLLAATKYGGTVAACGLAAGMDLSMTVAPFILRGVTLAGIDSVYVPNLQRRQAWHRLARDLPAGRLREISRSIPLDEVVAAAAKLLAGRVRGRLVVTLGN